MQSFKSMPDPTHETKTETNGANGAAPHVIAPPTPVAAPAQAAAPVQPKPAISTAAPAPAKPAVATAAPAPAKPATAAPAAPQHVTKETTVPARPQRRAAAGGGSAKHAPVVEAPVEAPFARFSVKIWTDPATKISYAAPWAQMDKRTGLFDVMLLSEKGNRRITLTAAQWQELPFHFFKDDGDAPHVLDGAR